MFQAEGGGEKERVQGNASFSKCMVFSCFPLYACYCCRLFYGRTIKYAAAEKKKRPCIKQMPQVYRVAPPLLLL